MIRQLTFVMLNAVLAQAYLPIEFDVKDAKDPTNLRGLNFVSRFMLPYGADLQSDPPQSPTDSKYRGYSYGMGTCEEVAYDIKNHYFYSATMLGYIIIVDLANPVEPALTDFSFNLLDRDSQLSAIEVCADQGIFFLTLADAGTVEMYETVKRNNPKTPRLLKSFDVGALPGFVLPNSKCDIVAVANANKGKGLASGGVTIIRNPQSDDAQVVHVPIDATKGWGDEYMLRKGINMPLSLGALEYWDLYSSMADKFDFAEIRAKYNSAILLEPKFMAWNPDETELLVNLQENNGLLRVDVAKASPLSVASYGVKDHSRVPVDLIDDGKCVLKTYESLFAMRNPDIISTIRYNGKVYVVTSNEGDYKKYEGFEERVKANELFQGNKTTLAGMVMPTKIFDPENPLAGAAAMFNSECVGDDCVSGTKLSLGSVSIDYDSDPTNPIFYRMVLHGGRGWSVYELPEDPENLLKLVYDSADYLERTGCDAYAWSHNAVIDEEQAPTSNLPNNTLWKVADEELREILVEMNDPEQDGCFDQGDGTPGACPLEQVVDSSSGSDGPAIERVTMGVACGRLVGVMAAEKSSIAFLFDLTNIQSPELKKVFHLSEATRTKSPGLAYNDGTIGEIDPENVLFFPAEKSPSGKPSLLFAGAHSGTISYWEFDCVEEDNANPETADAEVTSASFASSVLFLSITTAVSTALMLSMILI